jgi:hypothetical protein
LAVVCTRQRYPCESSAFVGFLTVDLDTLRIDTADSVLDYAALARSVIAAAQAPSESPPNRLSAHSRSCEVAEARHGPERRLRRRLFRRPHRGRRQTSERGKPSTTLRIAPGSSVHTLCHRQMLCGLRQSRPVVPSRQPPESRSGHTRVLRHPGHTLPTRIGQHDISKHAAASQRDKGTSMSVGSRMRHS